MISLWLVPETTAKAKLDNLIREMAKKHGTNGFDAHVSLLLAEVSDGEIEKKCKKIAEVVKGLRLELTEVSVSTTRHQCVFARVKTSTELMKIYQETMRECGMNLAERMYMPHLSLVYGEMDLETRVKTAESVELPMNSFVVGELWVMGEEMGPDSWERVHRLTV